MPRWWLGVVVLAAWPCCARIVNFDKAKPGTTPRDWLVAMTHEGGPPKWEVVEDPSAPSLPRVLGQTSTDNTNARYPLAIYQKAVITDGAASVRFKAVSGEKDQAAGIVWRYRDANNYYVVRANALEDNVVLYKVEDGKRTALAPKGTAAGTYGVNWKVPRQTWGELRVEFAAAHFTVFFNGEKVMEVEDNTFTGGGKTGLWTKADSVTWFDNFRVDRGDPRHAKAGGVGRGQ
jgi:hypothetical protein